MSEEKNEAKWEEYRKAAEQFAEHQAHKEYLEEWKKSQKALLMKQAEEANPGMSAALQEREALRHPEYQETLEGLKRATELAIKHRFQLKRFEIRMDEWRTRQSTRKAEMQLR